MKMSRAISLLISLMLSVTVLLSACGGTKSNEVKNNDESTVQTSQEVAKETEMETEKPKEKVKLVAIVKNKSLVYMDGIIEKVEKKFPDYEFIFKDWQGAEETVRTVKTLISAGEPCDLVLFYPQSMGTFVSADMALDLTPYLEANNGEWKKNFVDGGLELGKYNGKYYNTTFVTAYSGILANKDLLDQLGIQLNEGPWTWEEFINVLEKIKSKPGGVFPFGIRSDWSNWLIRNGLLSIWDSREKVNDFVNGKIPLTSPEVEKVMELSKAFYEKEYAYPGKGAIAVKDEEVTAAFKQGKIAMIACVNSLMGKTIANVELKNIQVLSWPRMGPQDLLLGGGDGFFIPAGSSFKEEAVEVLKYITGPECMQLGADTGATITARDVVVSDPLYGKYTSNSDKINGKEIIHFHTKLYTSVLKMPAEYIHNGKSSLEYLEKMRNEALEEMKTVK